MKLLRYGPIGRERPALMDAAGIIRDVAAIVPDFHAANLAAAIAALRGVPAESLPRVDGGERIGPPLQGVGKIVCVGLNYVDHARETGQIGRAHV